MRADTQQWWDQAQADLRSAQALMAAGEYYGVSWFAQQATEKGLKALYVELRNTVPPRTHDVRFLGTEVGAPAAVHTDLVVIFPAFDAARYPDASGGAPVNVIGVTMATSHLESARRVLRWIDKQF